MLGGCALVVLTFLIIDLPHGPEHWSSDFQIAWFSKAPATQDDRIIIVEIGEDELNDAPSISPIDRTLLADLVKKISKLNPKAIGLDFVFERRTDDNRDRALIEAARQSSAPIVVGRLDSRTRLTSSQQKFQDWFVKESGTRPSHVYFEGHVSPLVLHDSVVREVGIASTDAPPVKSFAEVLSAASGGPDRMLSRRISWLLKPVDPRGLETFYKIKASSVLNVSESVLREAFENRIVLVGENLFDRDQHLTPLSLRYNLDTPVYSFMLKHWHRSWISERHAPSVLRLVR